MGASEQENEHEGGEAIVRRRLKVFSGTAHQTLSEEIANYLGIGLGKATIKRFTMEKFTFKSKSPFAAPTSFSCNRRVRRRTIV